MSAQLMSRALKPNLVFGREVIPDLSREWGQYLLITMSEVYEAARPLLANPPTHVFFVESMDRPAVEQAERSLPQAETIVGIGGGMSLDLAKYVGWKRGQDPVLCPSIASVDACVTNTIAVRDQGKVRYIGFVAPRAVVCDFALMSGAPRRLNRAGIGDILSIHTGLHDWRLAANHGEIEFVDDVAAKVSALVRDLEGLTAELREVSDRALRWLIEAYAAENELCLSVGHSRPEEGSEHYLAYNLEHRTGHGFVHGELVCLGVLVMSRLQDNEPGRVHRLLEGTGVRYQPRDLGLSRRDFCEALITLPEYVKAEGLPYSIVNQARLDQAAVEQVIRDLVFA